ncbi:aspartate ammonia-lyase [Candidatus Woesearchaeota archaeon]|nr:aspartate ammonia-lyase [Candidatus Woesearchaeota archaeon]
MGRIERDALGELEVDEEAYYGIFTQRAKSNFQISGIRAKASFLKALAAIKKAAAKANMKRGMLDAKTGTAIIESAEAVMAGKHDEQFPLDVFQAGAGTPFNMNMNEVIANLATEKLGGRKGQYIVHPNDDVNMSQSTNDVIPTAIRIAALVETEGLLGELKLLSNAFSTLAQNHKGALKVARTHLQDAVPITFGQVFSSYAVSLSKCVARIESAKEELKELGIGGTAAGTGLNSHPEFRQLIISELQKETGIPFRAAADTVETTWSHSAFLHFSASLRTLAVEIAKLCDDLMLLNSGPKAGIGEIVLPEVEPGSSIMPGKVNPSIPECMRMVCFQVIGSDAAVVEAAKAGNLELNVNTPLIMHNILSSIGLLTNSARMFRTLCIEGLKVDEETSTRLFESSHVLATALSPYLGYDVVAALVKTALQEKKTIKEAILEKQLMTKEDMDRILKPEKMTQPGIIDKELAARIKASKAYTRFRESLGRDKPNLNKI